MKRIRVHVVRRGHEYAIWAARGRWGGRTLTTELEMVTLDQWVPGGHLLRLIDAHIRFDFIRQKAEGLYCANNGRPAIDPVVLFKMLTQKARTPGKTGGSSAVSGAAAPYFLVQKDVLALL